MIRKRLPDDRIFIKNNQYYLESTCPGCDRHIHTGKILSSINYWRETWDGQDRSDQYEFRYVLDHQSDLKGHPGLDLTNYCHYEFHH